VKDPLHVPPWPVRAYWWLVAMWHWPEDVRQLRQMGYHRAGWMRWEYDPTTPEDDRPRTWRFDWP
jgi:hypothetical protein